MMALTERMLDNTRTAIGKKMAAQSLPATGTDLRDNTQFPSDELNALRREQAKLQQAIFEAAQVQRRLCAPRELNWGEFEVAGEIFPVRHTSADRDGPPTAPWQRPSLL